MVGGGLHVDARETAERDMTQLLPDGVLTPGHHILVREDEESGEQRGVLSLGYRVTARLMRKPLRQPRGP